MENEKDYLYDEIFGAHRHDPALWDQHPLVTKADVQFDGLYGFVGLTIHRYADIDILPQIAISNQQPSNGQPPDLDFWGEGVCPVKIFERFPRVTNMVISTIAHLEHEPRTGWSAKLWLR